MKKTVKRMIGLMIAAVFLCTGCAGGTDTGEIEQSGAGVMASESIPVPGEDYLTSVHYFADGWSVNFWNCELDEADSQLDRIAADGFNSIILVIPWREFQPDMESLELTDYCVEKLTVLLEKAQEHHLGVFIRPGYTWDYYGDESVLTRYYQLMGDKNCRQAWLSYLSGLYDICSGYDCFLGGFLCWEDFWNYTYTAMALGEQREGEEEASFIGYHQYLEEHYTLEQVNHWYGEDFSDFSSVWFPSSDSPALRLFYEFYDDFLNRLLADSQQVFPSLSMEVRLDADPVISLSGESEYYSHQATYGCEDSSLTCVMYGIPMGFANEGERVDWQTAFHMTKSILDSLLEQNGSQDVYIDQFLYMDNTPGYTGNAQIIEEQLPEYLENIDEVLGETTVGYGVWTYRDYAADMLYNPQFALGFAGWETEGDAETAEWNGSLQAHLNGALLRQNIPAGRKTETGDDTIYVTFQTWCMKDTEVTVSMGSAGEVALYCEPEEDGGIQTWECSFQVTDNDYTLTICCDGEVYIDNVKVYAHVHTGMLYTMDGGEQSCLDSIRILNSRLRGIR